MFLKKLKLFFTVAPVASQYYNLSKSEYYIRHLFPFHVSLFLRFWEEEATLFSNAPILFRDFDFLVSSHDVQKLMGEPRFKHKSVVENNIYKIYFYKRKITNREVITQFHFINDQFFSGCYTFTKLPFGGIKTIEKAILEKYSPKKLPSDNKIHITDSSGNTIRVISNVNTNIFYLSGNANIKLLLPMLSEQFQKEKINEEIAILAEMQKNF